MQDIQVILKQYRTSVEAELVSLLNWWRAFTIDEQQGGFYGEVGNNNQPIPNAPKGIVLNSRILWTFSAAYLLRSDKEDLAIAKRAFKYIVDYFHDSSNGGFYWSLEANGTVLDGKKQIYGQAFAIYGLAEYYKASQDEQALTLAQETFQLIEQHSFDPVHLGYIDAFDQNWQAISDLRLSEKDLNAAKSMNTHLHVIEAYANLYQSWKDERLAKSIKELLLVFKKYIIADDHRLSLFFTPNWQPQSTLISYGHDIEAAWLLQACAEDLQDEDEISDFKVLAHQITLAAQAGIDVDGGMYYEFDPGTNCLVREKHWWPQAETMIGFFNAYQLSGDEHFLTSSIRSWRFILTNLKDDEKGEWFWGVYPDGSVMEQNKAGFWKCPYHNVRACIKIISPQT
jgi:mannobiose 2-epimerase